MPRKDTQEKIKRYSAVSIIMRQLYGTSMTSLPGYILLHNVLYKHFEDESKTLDELVQWACKKFTFKMSVEGGYTEIQNVITMATPDQSEEEDKERTRLLLQKVIEEADDLYNKNKLYEAVSGAVESMDFSDLLETEKKIDPNKVKQDLIKILFEIKRGKSLAEAVEKIAEETCEGCVPERFQNEKDKKINDLKKSVLLVFIDETELLKFEKSISVK